ncbi:MAG: hypothetical protein AB1486_24075 [Planctomycetota bacterium]
MLTFRVLRGFVLTSVATITIILTLLAYHSCWYGNDSVPLGTSFDSALSWITQPSRPERIVAPPSISARRGAPTSTSADWLPLAPPMLG